MELRLVNTEFGNSEGEFLCLRSSVFQKTAPLPPQKKGNMQSSAIYILIEGSLLGLGLVCPTQQSNRTHWEAEVFGGENLSPIKPPTI